MPQTPTGPTSGHPDSIYQFATVASDPDGDDVAVRFSWGSGDTSTWTDPACSGDTLLVSHAWDSLGSFSVTAQARDLKEAMSAWSDVLQVMIRVATQPPETPWPPLGKSHIHVGISYQYETSATDLDGDSVAFQFDWGDGDTSEWTRFVGSGATIAAVHTWSVAGTLEIKARAKDVHGSLSRWSSGAWLLVHDGNTPPSFSGAPTGRAVGMFDSTYVYRVSAADAEWDRVAYRFEWSDGDTTDWSAFVRPSESFPDSHAWRQPGTFRVRAQAKDSLGEVSEWSEALPVEMAPDYPRTVLMHAPAPKAPAGLALSPDGELLYVSGRDADSIWAIRTSDMSKAGATAVGRGPTSLAVSPDGATIYVANGRSHTVSVVRALDLEVVATVSVGAWPMGLAVTPDGKRAYVGASRTIDVVETNRCSVIASIPADVEYGIAVTPDGVYVLSTNYSDGYVGFIRTADHSVETTIAVEEPAYIALDPDGRRAYVTQEFVNKVAVIDIPNRVLAGEIAVGHIPLGVAAHPTAPYVYVAASGSGAAIVQRTLDHSQVCRIPVEEEPWAVAVHPRGSRVYVTNYISNTVTVIGY